MMRKNMGVADRIVRLSLVLLITVLYFTGVIGGTIGVILLIVAGILLLTSLFNFCPLYRGLGISTEKKAKP